MEIPNKDQDARKAQATIDQQKANQHENNVNPRRELDPSEDDELEAEQRPHGFSTANFIDENELERTDQDYRDGDNQSGEDQDDSDELRSGK